MFSLSNGLCRCICVLRCRRRLRLSSIITVNLPTTGRAKKKKKKRSDLVLLFQYGPTADHWKGVTTELFPFSLRGWFPPFRVQTAMVTIWQCIFLYDDTQMHLVCTVVHLRTQPYSNFLFLFFIFCRCSQIISGRRQCLYFWKLVCHFSCFRDSCPDLILLSRDVQTSSFEDRLQIKKWTFQICPRFETH